MRSVKGTGLLSFNGGSDNPDEDVVDCGACNGTGERNPKKKFKVNKTKYAEPSARQPK